MSWQIFTMRVIESTTRRRFLGQMGVVALATSLAACSRSAPDAGVDVLVLGAGMAGLGAARTIADAGRSVVVIEARDRRGGRLWTDHTTMSIPVERGAELIHGADASTWGLVRDGGIETEELRTAIVRFDPDAPWVDADTWRFYAFPQGRPDDLPDPLPEPRDEETAEQYLRRLGIERENYPLALLAIELDSERLDKVPAEDILDVVQEVVDAPGSGPVPAADDEDRDFRVIGGYDQVVNVLAKGLDVRLGRPVTHVSVSSAGVEVQAGGDRFGGRKLVVALPAGVLQQDTIVFDPPLSSQIRSRLAEVVYLPVFKGLLEFDEPVLPDGGAYVDTFSLNPPALWNGSAGTPDYSGQIVVAWATGDPARELLAMSEEDRLASSLEAIRSAAGDDGLETVTASTYDWSLDPFARGAYPGPTSRRDGLYEPIGDTLFWAGMTTWTVAESYDTGRDAGQAVLRALRGA